LPDYIRLSAAREEIKRNVKMRMEPPRDKERTICRQGHIYEEFESLEIIISKLLEAKK